ncbi:MAG: hypothetical protein IKY43_06265 [Bacteroidales bacterium]|nr:hypothetical protein [Bacteroidales bacterium]
MKRRIIVYLALMFLYSTPIFSQTDADGYIKNKMEIRKIFATDKYIHQEYVVETAKLTEGKLEALNNLKKELLKVYTGNDDAVKNSISSIEEKDVEFMLEEINGGRQVKIYVLVEKAKYFSTESNNSSNVQNISNTGKNTANTSKELTIEDVLDIKYKTVKGVHDKEKIREMKTSQKYYCSEIMPFKIKTAEDWAVRKNFLLSELARKLTIATSFERKDNTITLKSINQEDVIFYLEKFNSGRTKIYAFLEKDKDNNSLNATVEQEEVEEEVAKESVQEVTVPIEKVTEEVEDSVGESADNESEISYSDEEVIAEENSTLSYEEIPEIDDKSLSLIDTLLTKEEFKDFGQELQKLRRARKIRVYGKYADCSDVGASIWAVFDKNQKLVAILGPGLGSVYRKNYKTKEIDKLESYIESNEKYLAIWFRMYK